MAGGDRLRVDRQLDGAADAVARINAAVQGPVIDILVAQIPEFAALPRHVLFERIMTDPALGAGCFKLFRAKPELFHDLLVGTNGAPVADDNVMLECGRTLAGVIMMIVRNMARRYFRLKLNPPPEAPPPRSALDRLLDRAEFRLRQWTRRFRRATSKPRPRAAANAPGDSLYRALRDFLLHDWQVSLLPRYSTLPLALASEIGPQLLGCREVAEIDALVSRYQAPAPGPAAAPSVIPPIFDSDHREAEAAAEPATTLHRGGTRTTQWKGKK